MSKEKPFVTLDSVAVDLLNLKAATDQELARQYLQTLAFVRQQEKQAGIGIPRDAPPTKEIAVERLRNAEVGLTQRARVRTGQAAVALNRSASGLTKKLLTSAIAGVAITSVPALTGPLGVLAYSLRKPLVQDLRSNFSGLRTGFESSFKIEADYRAVDAVRRVQTRLDVPHARVPLSASPSMDRTGVGFTRTQMLDVMAGEMRSRFDAKCQSMSGDFLLWAQRLDEWKSQGRLPGNRAPNFAEWSRAILTVHADDHRMVHDRQPFELKHPEQTPESDTRLVSLTATPAISWADRTSVSRGVDIN